MFVSPFILADIVVRGLAGAIDELIDRTVTSVGSFFRAFPNPFAMADVVLRYFSGLVGLLVTIPIAGVETFFLEELARSKFGSRVIRVDDAVKEFFSIWKWTFRQVTFTDENGLVEAFFGVVGRAIYRMVKRVKLIAGLISAKTEAEFISVVINSFRSRLFLLRMIVIILGIIVTALIIGFYVWSISMAFWWISGNAFKAVLSQDSRIIKVKFPRGKTVRKRKNVRAGPDFPTAQT